MLCAGISYPFTHNLGELLWLAVPSYPQLARFAERLPGLTIYAITLRYDDMAPPDRQDAEEALALVRELREAVLAAL